MREIRLRILGPLEVHGHDGLIPIPGKRQRKLFAFLVINVNRVVPVERLIGELWEDPPPSARQQVYNSIGTLRNALGVASPGPRITRTDIGYRLESAEDEIDAHHFHSQVHQAEQAMAAGNTPMAIEALKSALALWRGEALEGIDSTGTRNTAAKLNEQRLIALEDLMSLRVTAGEARAAVSELRQLVCDHPFRESFRASLMRALYHDGRQADALAVYNEGRRVLVDELGLEPSPTLRGLHNTILSGSADDDRRMSWVG